VEFFDSELWRLGGVPGEDEDRNRPEDLRIFALDSERVNLVGHQNLGGLGTCFRICEEIRYENHPERYEAQKSFHAVF
jgi:hypothetical protein